MTEFDFHAAAYTEVHDKYLPPGIENADFFKQKKDWVLGLLDQYFTGEQDLSTLDFGCSIGSLCNALIAHPRVSRVIGIDESKDSLRLAAQALVNVTSKSFSFFQSAENAASTLSEKRVHLITAFNVFHHIAPEARAHVIASLSSCLADDGIIAVWEHNPLNPFAQILVKACPFDENAQLLRRRKTVELFRREGFQPLISEYLNVTPPKLHRFMPAGILERASTSLPLGAQYRILFKKHRIN
jgi:trans-aconitate methyltransferase